MKRKWLIALLALAVIFIGAGSYLGAEPEWTKGTYYDYYNEALSMYQDGKTEESLAQFTYIAGSTKDYWLKSLALSQLGYIIGKEVFDEKYSAESRYQIAQYVVGILEEAVVSNPDNGEAKYNLELLKNKLSGLSQQMANEKSESSGDESNPTPGYGHGDGERGY